MDKGYTAVADLKIDDALLSIDLVEGYVDAKDKVLEEVTVYNITVDESHNYFVGLGSFLVHNKGN